VEYNRRGLVITKLILIRFLILFFFSYFIVDVWRITLRLM
jgi:hypothetical protein